MNIPDWLGVGFVAFVLCCISGLALSSIGITIWLSIRQRTTFNKKLKQAEATFKYRATIATPATAKVLTSSSEIPRSGGRLIVTLNLAVQPTNGLPYPATTTWQIDPLAAAHVSPNQSVAIRIDQHDHSLIYPAEDWAEYYWQKTALLQNMI